MTSAVDRAHVVRGVAQAARQAARITAKSTPTQRTQALAAIADELLAQVPQIRAANEADLSRATDLAPAMRDRLRLTDASIGKLAAAVREIAAQPELLGRIEHEEQRPNGLVVQRVRIPLGVVLMIYEARPNVTVDAAALCLKAGNACILRGGREALESNKALLAAVQRGLQRTGLPAETVQLVPTTDREAIADLVKLDELIDLCIPRGGEGLIRYVAEHARVPVIKHYKGVCHVYVHAAADLDMAAAIVDNAKTSRPGVCNALETLLVDRTIAETFIPQLIARIGDRVELRGDPASQRLGVAKPATDDDYFAEYLDLILAVKVVDSLADAVAHIERYGSSHTESIITRDAAAAEQFIASIDSSTVMVNASTRFADGGELGLGAEIGISTTRLHAYGPMGAEGLTTMKFVVRGSGQVRQ